MGLGEKLKELRHGANLSLADLSDKTKIQLKYLSRLENEEFDKLPNPIYVKGFVKKWASACGAQSEDLLLQLHRENKIFIDQPTSPVYKSSSAPAFIFSVRHLIGIIVIILAATMGTYLFLSQRANIAEAQIEILKPLELNSVSSQEAMIIQGRAENVNTLIINGSEVQVQSDGTFEYNYYLEDGLNTIIIEANNQSGEKVEALRKVLKLDP